MASQVGGFSPEGEPVSALTVSHSTNQPLTLLPPSGGVVARAEGFFPASSSIPIRNHFASEASSFTGGGTSGSFSVSSRVSGFVSDLGHPIETPTVPANQKVEIEIAEDPTVAEGASDFTDSDGTSSANSSQWDSCHQLRVYDIQGRKYTKIVHYVPRDWDRDHKIVSATKVAHIKALAGGAAATITVACIGLVAWLSLRSQWSLQCDMEIKVWVVVMFAIASTKGIPMLLDGVFGLLNFKFWQKFFYWTVLVVDCTLLSWFFYGIKPIFIDSGLHWCSANSMSYGLIGWSGHWISFTVSPLIVFVALPIAWKRGKKDKWTKGPCKPKIVKKFQKHRTMTLYEATRLRLIRESIPQIETLQAYKSRMLQIGQFPGPIGDFTTWFCRKYILRAPPGWYELSRPVLGTYLCCVICGAEGFEFEEYITLLACPARDHIAHARCFETWCQANKCCPRCGCNQDYGCRFRTTHIPCPDEDL